MIRALCWLAAGLILGCGEGAPTPPPTVLYAGCAEAVASPRGEWTCLLEGGAENTEERSLSLWVDVPAAESPELRLDGEVLPWTGTNVRGGLHFEVPVGERPSVLELVAANGAWTWRLALAEREPLPPVLAEARTLWQTDPKAALRRLEEAAAAASPADRCQILRRLADSEKTLHEYWGDPSRGESALRLWEEAAEACRDASHLQGEADHRTVRVHYLIAERRFGEAYRELTAHPTPAGSPAVTTYLSDFYRGQLATEAGDFRSAGDALRSAVEVASRVNLQNLKRQALEQLGLLLQTQGQTDRATATFRQLARELRKAGDSHPCDRARLLSNQAWSLLLAREAEGWVFDHPIPLLEEADRIYSPEGSCAWPEKRRNGAINRALAHLQDARTAQAREALAAAGGSDGKESLLVRLWRLELLTRLALQEQRPREALDRYRQLDVLATDALWPEGRWRAAYGRARTHDALDDRQAALQAFEQAEQHLEEEMLRVAVHDGRGLFLAQREKATRHYLDILLALDRPDELREALGVARRSRARVIRSLWRGELPSALDPSDRQRLYDLVSDHRIAHETLERLMDEERRAPHDEIPRLEVEMESARHEIRRILDAEYEIFEGRRPELWTALEVPKPGHLVLVFHPLPQGWVGFAATRETVRAWRFDLPPGTLDDPEALSERLLMPAREDLEAARVVEVLAYGALRSVDVHALPYGRSVLLAEAPVLYRLDLPHTSSGDDPPRGSALVVADPLRDLPAARDEGRVVAEALGARLGQVMHLEREQAGRNAVLKRLAHTDLLHYAGHGRFRGWESNLPLADGHLGVGDLLQLETPPASVVLSACDSATSSHGAPQESIGLAQAFLLAGSDWVLAASRPVGDRAARSFFGRFYELWDGADDPAKALREAQLAWREADPEADWASFRLLKP